jgi:hypothetical protein
MKSERESRIPVFGGRDSELNEQAKPFERGGRGEREERQKNLKLSALFAPSAFNGLGPGQRGHGETCNSGAKIT